MWRYLLGSGSYPPNTAWQMALRCLAKCPSRAHRWGSCWGAQEAIWLHYEKLPRLVPNHQQLLTYMPGTFDGSAHQVNDVPQACHLQGKVGIWTRHGRWHAANGPLSGLTTIFPWIWNVSDICYLKFLFIFVLIWRKYLGYCNKYFKWILLWNVYKRIYVSFYLRYL